ncbi:MAG: exopolyphosphatase / guanosine-5-triphosphate,3-diphosphate pyrophosphatase [Bacillota bacterium]|nr:exopolyphosphatase / guanosine-5-triphosphate,3-diphosphate pyrophosphatase [Bacillota bacterium]
MRLAAIDIGTNSTRLLVAEKASESLRPVCHELATTRLGQGIGQSNILLPEAQERTVRAVARFLDLARSLGATRFRLFATSAVRDAANREEFLHRVEVATGRKPEVLSGEEEAYLSYLGATRALGLNGLALVIDAGGGSTEFIWGAGSELFEVHSLKIGAVRLTEIYLKSNPPSKEEWSALVCAVARALAPLRARWRGRTGQAVAVGGTATTLAAVAQGMSSYCPEKVQGYYLSAEKVKSLAEKLAGLSVSERRQIAGIPAGRADIIAAGAGILAVAVDELALSGITVSDQDLLLGSLYSIAC